MQIIRIYHLKQPFRIGWSNEERSVPQLLTFEIDLHFSQERVAVTDHLDDTIDYMEVMSVILSMGENGEWKLIEKLTSDCAKKLFEEFVKLEEVKISIKKLVCEQCDYVECVRTFLR